MSTTTQPAKLDVYSIVTNRIIELLEYRMPPWQRPWTDAGIPSNLISKRPYRGINVWLLASLNYPQNLFLTFEQLHSLGGSVNAGEHGHVVVFWKRPEKKAEEVLEDEKEAEKKSYSILRYYKVFNVSQCRNLPEEKVIQIDHGHTPIDECEAIIKQMPSCPPIRYKEQKAYYDIANDYINMPKKKSFVSIESYYRTLFHELVHSTGHEKRLFRKTINEMAEFGSESYSIEELVAELGSCYLSNLTGINAEINNSAAYIEGWLSQLKNDKRFILFAASHAQRATDYIVNVQKEESKDAAEQSEVLAEN